MRRVHVRLDDAGGIPMARAALESVYTSGLEFEPDERRQVILADGTVELAGVCERYMVHAKVNLPFYGSLWVTADNEGAGYTGDFVDFVLEAVRSYVREAETYGEGVALSPAARGHLAAAKEFFHLANRGKSTAENRLYALSHAVYAAEGALCESARQKVLAAPRGDMLLGCNFFRYTAPDTFYAKFFAKVFDFATLPFYAGKTVPSPGKYEYGYIDAALEFLESKRITAKGHPVWFGHEEVNPQWLFGLPFKTLQQHAREIALHHAGTYKGRVGVWDAMNEAHDWANCFGLTQPELVELTRTCCDAVHEADPAAQAVVNVCIPFGEYAAGRYVCYGPLPEKLRSPLAYFRAILEAGVQYDVTGIQLYFPARDMTAIHRILSLYESLGKPVHITEMGVNGGRRGRTTQGGSSWAQLSLSEGGWHGGWSERVQADWLEQFYTIAAAHSEIKALTWWDFIEPSFSGDGAFLYEDENPREIYFRLLSLKDCIFKK
jgi:GH35 family endo-1,4-beta-xylanase